MDGAAEEPWAVGSITSACERFRAKLPKKCTLLQRTCTIYRGGARHPRHLNARVSVLLLLR